MLSVWDDHVKQVYRLNFDSSTADLHFANGWSQLTFINCYDAPLFLSTVFVNGTLHKSHCHHHRHHHA